jgi:hypothetical protein
MKKLIAIAAIVIASVTTAQVKAQTAAERIIISIDTFMKAQHPEYAKIERYKVIDATDDGSQVIPTFENNIIPLGKQGIAFKSNYIDPLAEKMIVEKIIRDINSEENSTYNYNLYSLNVIQKEGVIYFVMIQDYQTRPTLESVRKQMLEQN